MTAKDLPPEALKESIFDFISECRTMLKNGDVDMSQLESRVRAYCDVISAMPKEEGKRHAEDLKELMQLISEFGEELAIERDNVAQELNKLEINRKANIAYKNSDGRIVVKNETME